MWYAVNRFGCVFGHLIGRLLPVRVARYMSMKQQFDTTPDAQLATMGSFLAVRPRFSWRSTTIATVLTGLILGTWLEYRSLLVGAAELWIVSDPATHADAIVVLGGDFQARPLVAADLYHRGFANKILVSQTDKGRGNSPSYTELSRAALLKQDVPAAAVETFGDANKNSAEEAVALKEWAERNTASVFIIPDEIFGTRRARWIFRREFLGSNVNVEVFGFEPPAYNRGEWWQTEQGRIAFQNELLKYVYYRLRY
jgi:uncharacterized SAM-binding protein YcdF (DUF218 family)